MIKKLEGLRGAKKIVETYTIAMFDWIEAKPHHFRVWLDFFNHCAKSKKYRLKNTEYALVGEERIKKMIILGIEDESFKCTNPDELAKMVQTFLTGALVTYITEEHSNKKIYKSNTLKTIFTLLEAK